MRTLLIEDEVIARTMASQVIESLDCQCDTAENGQEALELVNKNSYDFILCDLGLPDISGFEVARQIRAGNSANKNISIFALSAHNDKEHEARSLDSGMTYFLKKPLNEKTLKGVLSCVAAESC